MHPSYTEAGLDLSMIVSSKINKASLFQKKNDWLGLLASEEPPSSARRPISLVDHSGILIAYVQ